MANRSLSEEKMTAGYSGLKVPKARILSLSSPTGEFCSDLMLTVAVEEEGKFGDLKHCLLRAARAG